MLPLSGDLLALFDFPVCLAMREPGDFLHKLSTEEQALTGKMGNSRLAGFSAGRLAAKEALLQLGIENSPILIGDKRRPIWPASVHGSISHCKDQCLAVVAESRYCSNLGVDVEQLKPLQEGVRNMIMTPMEREHLAAWAASLTADPPAGMPDHLSKALPWECVFFSLKESIFKCLNPLTYKWIDFHQANITLHAGSGTCSIKLDPSVHTEQTGQGTLVGRYLCTDSHVFSAVSLVN